MARWNSANVLQTNAGGRRLWHLTSSGDRFVVQSESILLQNEPCPPLLAAKDWKTLVRKKLNVAWLPADNVFFRALHLPSSDPAEIASMVELQLEKVSPLPIGQIVWSLYLLPRPADKPDALQTVLVVIAGRAAVEEFLGQVEKDGFLPDRLEAPGLEQLLAVKIQDEGVWIFAGAAGEPALAVWYYGGVIQNVTLVTLSLGPERGAQLKTQLEQIAWAGELEGWLTGPLRVHLLTGPDDAAFWEAAFQDWGENLQLTPPPAPKELAALSAQRCAGNAPSTSLLPPEFAARYRQQFTDHLWMRGLGAVAAFYVLGVLFYFGVLYVFQLQDVKAQGILASMGTSFTNSQRDVAQIGILEDRQKFKYAALDCWKAVAENMPESIMVDSLYFQGDKLELNGTVVAESSEDVGNFNEALRSAKDLNNNILFADVSPPSLRINGDKGTWHFNCTLKKTGQEETQ